MTNQDIEEILTLAYGRGVNPVIEDIAAMKKKTIGTINRILKRYAHQGFPRRKTSIMNAVKFDEHDDVILADIVRDWELT